MPLPENPTVVVSPVIASGPPGEGGGGGGAATSLDPGNGSTVVGGDPAYGSGMGGGIEQVCFADYRMRWEGGRLWYFSQSGTEVRAVHMNFDAPSVNDDDTASKRFVVGSRWYHQDGRCWTCTDATEGAAVWVSVTDGSESYDMGALSGSVTPDLANGLRQRVEASSSITIEAPVGNPFNHTTDLLLDVLCFSPDLTLDFSSSIQRDYTSGETFPRALLNGYSYRIKLAYRGYQWCLDAITGGHFIAP